MLKKLLERISIPTPKHLKPESRKRVLMRRYLAAALCGCMMVPTIGSIAMATEETASVCPNHQEHDESCGYDANGECSHVCPECTLVAGALEANMNENISEADESSSTDATGETLTDANSDAVDLLDDTNISDTDMNPVDDTEANTDTEVDESTDVNTDLETADDIIQPAATDDDAEIQPYTDSFPADGLNDIIVRAISNWNYVVSGETAEGDYPHFFKLKMDLSKDGVLNKEALLAKLPAKISANFTVTDESTEGADQSQELDITWDLSAIPDTPTEETYTISATAKGYGFQDGDTPQAEIKLIPQAYGVELNGKVYDTLQGAIDKAVKGNTITFLSDLTEHVNVPKSITIDLNGHTLTSDSGATMSIKGHLSYLTVKNGTIKAADGCNAIYGTSNSSYHADVLTLEGITFTGAKDAVDYEYMPTCVKTVAVKDCVFTGNDGALSIDRRLNQNPTSTLTIENTKFINNNSTASAVVYAPYTNITIKDSEFSENILGQNTGNIRATQLYTTYGALNVENTSFSNNKGDTTIYAINSKNILLENVTATGNVTDHNRSSMGYGGGLLYASSVKGDITLKNVTAEGNSVAYGSGGAVLITGTSTSPAITMENCTFERNIAGSQKTTYEGNGGAVGITSNFTSLTMTGCIFNNNQAMGTKDYYTTGGGGVYINRGKGSNVVPINISSCMFQNNEAARLGGGICVVTTVSKGKAMYPVNVTLDSCTISGNAAMRGGGLWVKEPEVTIKDTNINGNTANMAVNSIWSTQVALPGGGIYIENLKDTVVNLTGSTHVYNNQTPNERVYAAGTNKGITSDIFLGTTSSSPMTLNIDSGVLEPYQTGESTYTLTDSGAISTTALKGYYSATIRPTGVYFDAKERQHPAEGDIVVNTLAGAVEAAKNASQNKVYICGTVALTQEIADIMNQNSDITFVRCEDHGTNCAMFSMSGSVNVTLNGAHIDGQKIQSSGSLISISAGGNLTVTGNTIIENGYTTGNGGAISLSQSSLTMTGGEIRNNYAAKNGGGIYAWSNYNGSGLTFEGGIIFNNRASNGGGALIGYTPANFGVNGGKTVFDGNTAYIGGGVYLDRETFHIDRAEFTNNISTRESGSYYCGGGIYIEHSTVVYMKNVFISDNISTKTGSEPRGGGLGICPTGGVVILDNDGLLSVNNGSSDIAMNLTVYGNIWGPLVKDVTDFEGTYTEKDAALLLSKHALGGGEVSYEKYVNRQLVPLSDEELKNGLSGSAAYKTIASEQTIQWAREQAEANGVIVTGNKAQLIGSGIMTNGKLIIGTDWKGIGIQKNWYDINLKEFITDEDKLPAQLIVHLMRKNSQGEWEMVDESARSDAIVALNEKNGWFYHWGNLGVTAEWGVAEVSPEGWKLIDVKNALDATPDSYTFWPMVSKGTTIKLNILNNYGRIEKIVTENEDGTGAVTGYISAVYEGDRVLDSTSGTYVPAEKTTYYLWNIDETGNLLTYAGETEMKEPARTGSKELPFLSMMDLSQITRGNLNNYGHIIKIFNQNDAQDDISKSLSRN